MSSNNSPISAHVEMHWVAVGRKRSTELVEHVIGIYSMMRSSN